MIRLACQVPGCRRTRGQRKGEPPVEAHHQWICVDHWRDVPRLRRQVYSRTVRAYNAATGLERGRLTLLCHDLWEALKRTAIERAAGL